MRRVVFDLVAGDEVDGEVAGLGMGEVEAADRGAGIHRERLGQDDLGGLLDVQQAPEVALLGMVGRAGIARGRPDALVFLFDQVVDRQSFVAAVAPVFAGLLVQHFGQAFGEPVGQCLAHDRVVIVVIALELLDQRLELEPGRDGERPQVVGDAGLARGDVVGQRSERRLAVALPLLPQRGEPHPLGRSATRRCK